jgi:anti-sigma-K factor RskA
MDPAETATDSPPSAGGRRSHRKRRAFWKRRRFWIAVLAALIAIAVVILTVSAIGSRSREVN